MKKGQSSVEMMVTVAVAIAFLFPLALLFFSTAGLKSQELSRLQAKILAQQIADEAGNVWFQGAGAKRAVVVQYPDHLLNVSVNGTQVVVTLDSENGPNDFVAYAPCNIVDAAYFDTGSYSWVVMTDKKLSAARQGKHVPSGLVVLVFETDSEGSVMVFRPMGQSYDIST